MKFRKLVIFFILMMALVCFFTKPTKQEFLDYIQPSVSRTGLSPAVDYQDKFLYVSVTALYVNTLHPIQQNGREVAPAFKEEYIGVFKKFWKLGQ